MTGLKIKDGHCVRTPRGQTLVLKVATYMLHPDGLPERLGNLLLSFRVLWGRVGHSL
jgi:hypothetical protein